MTAPNSAAPDVPQSYDSFVAEFYDYLPLLKGRDDVAFYLEFARACPGPVLELGCGTGRILLPMADSGCEITGLDLSEPMLVRCRAKLAGCPGEVQQRVHLIHADMTSFDFGRTFMLITIPFRPFQHLQTLGEQLSCLRAVHRHLAPGGRFILDLFHVEPRRMVDPVYLQESELHPEIALPDGRRVRLTERVTEFHRAAQANDVAFTYYVTHPGGGQQRLVHSFRVRYFFRYEVEHLLARCGLRITELFGDFDRSALRDDSPEMLFVAEKA